MMTAIFLHLNYHHYLHYCPYSTTILSTSVIANEGESESGGAANNLLQVFCIVGFVCICKYCNNCVVFVL